MTEWTNLISYPYSCLARSRISAFYLNPNLIAPDFDKICIEFWHGNLLTRHDLKTDTVCVSMETQNDRHIKDFATEQTRFMFTKPPFLTPPLSSHKWQCNVLTTSNGFVVNNREIPITKPLEVVDKLRYQIARSRRSRSARSRWRVCIACNGSGVRDS